MLPDKSNDLQVHTHVVPQPGGAKLVFMTSQGKYVGTVTFDAADPSSLAVLGSLFQQFCSQQAGGIQVVGANSVPGLRAS